MGKQNNTELMLRGTSLHLQWDVLYFVTWHYSQNSDGHLMSVISLFAKGREFLPYTFSCLIFLMSFSSGLLHNNQKSYGHGNNKEKA